MRQQIIQEIANLEQELNIKILYAVESGSRAWGFASQNSDWDVRFIYVHSLDWYLSIDNKKDSYERILPNDIDLSGWELKKTLKLFRKSNPPLFEWLQSPIIYSEKESLATDLRNLAGTYFNPKSCLYHYLHMAEGNYRDYLKNEQVRIKKYFYVLRPILACHWVEHKKQMPPMEFEKLLDFAQLNPELKQEIDSLLERKMEGQELGLEPRIPILNEFLEAKIEYYQNYLKDYPAPHKPETKVLDELFRKTLYQG